MKSITLTCTDGANKQYTVQIRPEGSGYIVIGIGGAIGGTMTTYPKTTKPVSEAEATKVYNKLVAEKLAKGYKAGADSAPVQTPNKADPAPSQYRPMLLNPITRAEAMALIADSRWLLEHKFDGIRCLLHKTGNQVSGVSRTAKAITLPLSVVNAARLLDVDFVLDGELVDGYFVCFDVLKWDGVDLSNKPCEYRAGYYQEALKGHESGIIAAPVAITVAEKTAFFKTLEEKGAEGAVFKLRSAPYTAGRPNSGGNGRKFKFTQSASVIVSGPNGTKSSVAIKLFDGTDLGHVTIPVNVKELPKAGQIIEVRYLYRSDSGRGHLIQAVYLGVRTDIEPEDCTADQLQVKGEER